MGVLRSPFFISTVVALIAAVIALVAGVALTFTDLNDAPVPASIWGRSHSYEFRNFIRTSTSGAIDYMERYANEAIDGIDGQFEGATAPAPPLAPGTIGGSSGGSY
jgi:hypothetical protein